MFLVLQCGHANHSLWASHSFKNPLDPCWHKPQCSLVFEGFVTRESLLTFKDKPHFFHTLHRLTSKLTDRRTKMNTETQELNGGSVQRLVRQTDQLLEAPLAEALHSRGLYIEAPESSLPCTWPVRLASRAANESAMHLRKSLSLLWLAWRLLLMSLKTYATSYWQHRILYRVFGRVSKQGALLYSLPNVEAEPRDK